MTCAFCGPLDGVVFEDAEFIVFLDHRPLFPGHVLVAPKRHYETLLEVPAELIGPLFEHVRRLARAMETGLGAEGSFVAVNTRVSQSVPHLHVHVVPRNKQDGLRGFFWPRRKYASAEEMEAVRGRLRSALQQGF
jgi:histidine triad (HIT) family protein